MARGRSEYTESPVTKRVKNRSALSITIYGIKNCETMNEVRAWLDKHGADFAFHNYKTSDIDRQRQEA